MSKFRSYEMRVTVSLEIEEFDNGIDKAVWLIVDGIKGVRIDSDLERAKLETIFKNKKRKSRLWKSK